MSPPNIAEIALFTFPLITGTGLVALAQPQRRGGICNVTPRLQPPGWVFSVVWPALYLLLGAALVLVWRSKRMPVFLTLLGGILALQAWWWIFSSTCRPKAAYYSLVAITVGFAAFAAHQFSNTSSRPVALLLAPLVVWCSFASYLSYQIWTGDVRKP